MKKKDKIKAHDTYDKKGRQDRRNAMEEWLKEQIEFYNKLQDLPAIGPEFTDLHKTYCKEMAQVHKKALDKVKKSHKGNI